MWHGSAIGWPVSESDKVKILPVVNERFSAIRYTPGSLSMLLLSVYFPTSSKDEEFIDVIANLSEFIACNRLDNEIIIIGADKNCSDKSSKTRQRVMKEFTNKFNLTGAKQSNNDESPTFHHNNGTSESSIDDVLVSCNTNLVRVVDQPCTLIHPNNLSDHDPVVVNLSFINDNNDEEIEDYSSTYTDLPSKKVKWDEHCMANYQQLAAKIIGEAVENYSGDNNLSLLTELVETKLVLAAESTFQILEPREKKQRKGFSESKAENVAWKKYNSSFRQFCAAGKPSDKNHPARKARDNARDELRRVKRQEQNKKADKLHSELMNTHADNISKVPQKLKKIRGDRGNPPLSSINTLAGVYTGDNVLEGFCSNAEKLATPDNNNTFSSDFYNMIIEDNKYNDLSRPGKYSFQETKTRKSC